MSAHGLIQAAQDAASAPAVKLSASGTSVAAIVDFFYSGPGLIALAGFALTGGTFLVNLWLSLERLRRERELHRLKVLRLNAGLPLPHGIESDRVDLDE